MFAHKAPTLEEGTCYQDPFWHYPVHKKLDHEKDFSKSHFWPNPTQLTDTPQEEALRLDVQEVLKNLTSFDDGKETQEWA